MAYLTNQHFKDLVPNNFEIWRLSSKAVQFKNSDGSISGAIYINTVVIQIDKIAKTAVLNSGWWHTATTKKWINYVLNSYWYRVFQKDFTRYVETPDGETLDFVDNMTIAI